MAEKSVERSVGRQIRAIRESRGLSLRSLATLSGLSANAISLIERGENSATIGSLHAMATALGVSLSEFFQDGNQTNLILTRADRRFRSQSGGLTLENLGSGLRDQSLEPFLMTVEPGAGLAESVSHEGQELVHVLAGEIEYTVNAERYVLQTGDSLLFRAEQVHTFYNATTEPAQMLIIFTAESASHLVASFPTEETHVS